MLEYLPSLAFGAFFLACAWANWHNLFSAPTANRVSAIMFVGGISGAIACWLWPEGALKGFWWVPFLVDLPGTIGMNRAAAEMPETPARREEREHFEADFRRKQEEKEARLRALERALAGCILGTAVGDALGLACEGLSPQRQKKLFPDPARYHLLPFGRGMCSDDTEHTVMLAYSMLASSEYTEDEAQAREVMSRFAWQLRFWLLGLPAGVGMATARAVLKLWLFIPPRWSGVWSAGNGPSMRSALLGVAYGARPERMRVMVRASTRITHTDPKAEQAALTVALAAQGIPKNEFLQVCRSQAGAGAGEWLALLERTVASVERRETTLAFASSLGLGKGVTGYSFHTVPVALHAWLSHPGDYRGAVLAAIECGGDTDTVAAITGAIAGAGVGKDGIPAEWLARLAEWPRTVQWMEQLAALLARRIAGEMPIAERPPWARATKLLLRNVFFLAVVLAHGVRRLLPPY